MGQLNMGRAMFSMTFDRAFGVGVALFSGKTNEDADYERYCESVRVLDVLAATRTLPALILVIDRENPMPTALWRKRMADARDKLRCKPVVAFVCVSPLLRGAIRAAEWLKPRPFPFVVEDDFAAAAQWVEGHRPGTQKLLRRLHDELRAGITRTVAEL
jgi:hypothetical protein